jgi:hypothetical protein
VLAEVEEPPERWTRGLRDLMRGAEEAERRRTPGSKASTPRDPDQDHVDLRAGALDPSWRLPKDTLHVEVLMSPRTKGKHAPRTGHLLVAPKGTATWIGYSENAAAVASRIRVALDDATEVGTLAKSAQAISLRTRPALAAGLGSIFGVGALTAASGPNADPRNMMRAPSRLSALGSAGRETVTWTAGADATPGAVHVTLRAQASRQTAMDFVHFLGL